MPKDHRTPQLESVPPFPSDIRSMTAYVTAYGKPANIEAGMVKLEPNLTIKS